MYRALESFTTKDYDIRKKQILEEDFAPQDEINEYLNIGYIEVYDSSLEITENGTYNVASYANANVNVSSGDDFSISDVRYLFYYGSRTNDLNAYISKFNNITNTNYMFCRCSALTTIPLFDISTVDSMEYMFQYCSALTTIPLFDTSKVQYMYQSFYGCSSLSNDSLNNILLMCKNSKLSSNKTLSWIGLSSTQATTCQGLSNYQAFLDAGWTTGY